MASASSLSTLQCHAFYSRIGFVTLNKNRTNQFPVSLPFTMHYPDSHLRVSKAKRIIVRATVDGRNFHDNDENDLEKIREDLEKVINNNDPMFSGLELANLIRSRYGRSYDVTLIKKEFMGRSLLALNVMWKYLEQRSFPLTEEEYLLRLDDVANNLRYWGAVSHVRNSLATVKERPRIGKAVSIFIDADESGSRSSEWTYR